MRTARSRISGENFGDFLILAPFSSEGASAKPGAVQRLDAAPAHATAIEQQLFKAMKVCGQMPHTGERMRKIIDLAANQLEADTLLDARED